MADRKRIPDLSKRLGSVLRSAQDRRLGLRAVRAGLLSEQDLAGPFGVDELLQMKGVTAEQIKELQIEIDREDYALFRPDRPTPPEVLEALGEPDRRLAEFVRVSRLGQGGIGEVWKAWDTRLGRWVAVKLPMATPDQDGATERFTREALAAARLTHPNIVSIHRVAEESGRCFIVMQYVEGQPLRRAKLEPKKALEIVRDVALAVHYAHEQGVIHRDLKPANIMLDLDGRPFVLDFGLAHLEEAGRVQSRENLVAGTAAYMSPEQARGGPAARERATDVYALGATLYEAVTGRAPFDGATFAETIEKVLHGEPVPPRTLEPSLSRDVEMVIQKAMDKEPARRYGTATEFAEDLDRCLRGEPVLARQGAVGKTIRRGLRQNPRLPWMAAAGILVAVAVGAWVLAGVERRDADKRAREQELQGIRDVAQLSVQAMLKLRRAGANEGMGEFLKKVEEAHATASARELAGAEIDTLMGRAFRAAMEDERALDFQSQALAKDPQYAPAMYEKIVLRAKEDLSLVRDDARILSIDDPKDAAGLVIKGLCAFHQPGALSARSLFESATVADPFREEAWELLALTWLASVGPHSAVKEQEEAYRRAEAVLSEGIERDRGYAPFWIGRGKLKGSRAQLSRETGQDPVLDFQSAEDDLTQAIKLRPSGTASVARARLRIQYGVHRMSRGENPTTEFGEAEADLEEAARRAPAEPFVLAAQSALSRHRGEYRILKGESPLKDLEALEQKAATFLKGRPVPAEAWMNMGLLWSQQAQFRSGFGEDPSGDYKRVEDSFSQAQAWSSLELQERRAHVLVQKARWRAKPGKEHGNEDLTAAEATLDQVIAGCALFNEALITRARARRTRGEGLIHCNQDPTARFEEALKDLERVHEINPVNAEASVERGHLELHWARHRTKLSDRQGAIDHYGKAVRFFEEAVHIQDSLAPSLREPLREARRGLLGP